MATLDYIDIPEGSTRLRSMPNRQQQQHDEKTHHPNHGIRPAAKVITSIPNPSPPHSPAPRTRRPSLLSTTANSLNSPSSAMSFIPQMLLSAALPPMSPGSPATTPTLSNPKRSGLESFTLMSTKDPLSLPIMSTNFKRFVTIIGPVFWLQDRMEEIVLWKRGTLKTSVWMAAYAFLCFYPRLLLLLPHIVLIAIILATYPYPASASADPLYLSNDANSTSPPSITPPAEGSVPWQANIQGIQNLMGAVADLHALVEPHLYHLVLTPQHLAKRPANSNSHSNHDSAHGLSQQPSTSPLPRSPYTAHILTLLFVSFPPLLFIVHLPIFPIREVCLVAGLAPFVVSHPYVRMVLPVLTRILVDAAPILLARWRKVQKRIVSMNLKVFGVDVAGVLGLHHHGAIVKGKDEDAEDKVQEKMLPASTVLQRIIDDDRLSDECWNAEMREVQLWENERYGGPLPSDSPAMIASTLAGGGSSSSGFLPPQKGWSKLNLKPGERGAWTRGQDGWSGSGSGGGDGSGVEVGGEVSSNLTFSLAPGWRFVETEDWRKDLKCAWSGCGGDPDGWVYTNDAWLGSRPAPYTSGGGSVTRRRRWIRRVWFDQQKAKEDS